MNNQPPKIRSYWKEQGGIYAGIICDVKTEKSWHLIVSENKPDCELEWGPYGVEIDGCSDYTDGQANTKAIIESSHKCPAAQWAAELQVDGFSDWYLPAQKELNLIYINLSDKCAPDWHWSSTQYSAYNAWLQDFENGYQRISYKDPERAVRAVRRLPI